MNTVVRKLSDADFGREVLQESLPVLVDFWADWCGPCKAMEPIIEEMAKQYEGRLKVVKLNVDENAETPAQYRIRSIPTLMLFKEGEIALTKVGAMPRSELSALIGSQL